MEKSIVFVVVRHFYDSNIHESNFQVCFVSSDKVKVDKILNQYNSVPGCFYECIETELFD